MATSAPCLAKAMAVEATMPRVPPVTRAILPDRFMGAKVSVWPAHIQLSPEEFVSGFACSRMYYSWKRMTEDQTLLREYVERGSEAAFATLVERHVNLVYSAALRQVRSPDLARDVVQQVFTDLARKAPSCLTGVIIAGWLHRATVYASSRLIRTEIRRKAREQEALTMIDSVPGNDWQQIGPILDSALEQLSARDRDALLLRFFEERSLKELGHMIGLGEEAARKRVSRALEKLRGLLLKQGISTSAVALSSALGTHAVEVAPAGLAQGLAGIAAATGKATTIGNALTLW